MIRLHLVRHGPTHARGMVGWSDLPADLSDSAALARLSANLPRCAALVSSDLLRAVQTADAIASGQERLENRVDLREMHFGKWELRRHDEVEAEDPGHIRAFWNRPGDIAPPGGESWNGLCARVDRAIDQLIGMSPQADLIVVAHFGVILSQIQRALDIAPAEAFSHRIDTLSVTRLAQDGKSWRVEAINRSP